MTVVPPRIRLPWWRIWEGIERFDGAALAVDLAISLVVLAVAAFGFEVWRRRRRRIWQLHLVDLLGMMAMVACLAGYLSYHRAEYRRELEVLRAIDFYTRHEITDRRSALNRAEWQQGGSEWLRAIVGEKPLRIFDRVISIDDIGGTEWEYAVRLRHLRRAQVAVLPFGDQQMRALARHPCLETLTAIGAYPFPLAGEQEYRLPSLPHLCGLNMVGTAFAGDGLEHALKLEHLHLTNTLFDDDHAPVLARLKRLRKLSLAETKITGASLVHLSALTQLEELDLAKTQVSDASLDHLAGLKKLRLLILHDTQVTAAGAAELQKSLPECEIQLEGSRMLLGGRG